MRVFFCANQISLTIAATLNAIDSVIFFDPVRCDIQPLLQLSAKFIPYSRLNLIIFFIGNWYKRPAEICVPHMLWGRLIRLYCRLGRKLSAIDDGLDTFRELPRNLNPALFKDGTSYYTFDYPFTTAAWLLKFEIAKVCPISNIASSSRSQVDLSLYDQLIIDSPGVQAIETKLPITNKTLLVKHSNPNKSVFRQAVQSKICGNEFALEKSLHSFKGTLVTGESMATVYALSQKNPSFRVIVCIQKENRQNLKSLIAIIDKTSFAELYLTEN